MSKTYTYTLNKEYSLQYTGFTVSSLISRGFTGHEHLDNVQLINMNGRLYDPIIARFLSPDNNVQMPDYTQNLNRYSYALNNLLVYTDPDGEFIFTLLAAIFCPPLIPLGIVMDIGAATGAFQGGVIANGTTDPTMWNWDSNTFNKMAIGAGIGAAAGAASFGVGAYVGGAVAAAQIGGAAGGAIVGAASGATAGFINGTGMAMLGGDSFGDALVDGAIQGGIGALAGGIIGGTVSGIQAKMANKNANFWTGQVGEQNIITDGRVVITDESDNWANDKGIRINIPDGNAQTTVTVPKGITPNNANSAFYMKSNGAVFSQSATVNGQNVTLNTSIFGSTRNSAIIRGTRPTYVHFRKGDYWFNFLKLNR